MPSIRVARLRTRTQADPMLTALYILVDLFRERRVEDIERLRFAADTHLKQLNDLAFYERTYNAADTADDNDAA